MSKHTDKELANAILIFALCGLIALLFGWKPALGTFLVIVILTQITVLLGGKSETRNN